MAKESSLSSPPPLSSRWSLRGFTALITGGSRGIGRAIAEELLEFGCSVYICARSSSAIDDCLKAWREAGWSAEGSVCDVSSREARLELMQKVSEHFHGKLDILVNNAGISGPMKPALDVTEEQYASLMATNLDSAFHLCQLAHPFLKASTKGSVVFISSILGLLPIDLPFNTYGVTKAAVNHLTKSLANEWSSDGIRVNCVAPGIVRSDMTAEILSIPGMMSRLEKQIPLGRPGYPWEIAAAVAFLCMPCSAFCCGQVLAIDGGSTVKGLVWN
eukprot:c23517_g1_i1 orf=314-1135(-)